MIAALTYALVSAGVERLTGSFWKAAFWPYYAGILLGTVITAHDKIKRKRDAGNEL